MKDQQTTATTCQLCTASPAAHAHDPESGETICPPRCEFVSMGMRCVLPEHNGDGHCPSICPDGPCGLCSAHEHNRSEETL